MFPTLLFLIMIQPTSVIQGAADMDLVGVQTPTFAPIGSPTEGETQDPIPYGPPPASNHNPQAGGLPPAVVCNSAASVTIAWIGSPSIPLPDDDNPPGGNSPPPVVVATV